MNAQHQALIRALIAAQVAVLEHADEDLAVHRAKAAVLHCLKEATALARKLDD